MVAVAATHGLYLLWQFSKIIVHKIKNAKIRELDKVWWKAAQSIVGEIDLAERVKRAYERGQRGDSVIGQIENPYFL